MRDLFSRHSHNNELISSSLHDQDTFYGAFLKDIKRCQRELIIESPFITERRMTALLPVLQRLRKHGVCILINTRDPIEHDGTYQDQASEAIARMQELGVKVLYTSGHHRKLAVIDRSVVWEGSLNILSFNDSCEIMRRIESISLARQLLRFITVDKYTKEF